MVPRCTGWRLLLILATLVITETWSSREGERQPSVLISKHWYCKQWFVLCILYFVAVYSQAIFHPNLSSRLSRRMATLTDKEAMRETVRGQILKRLLSMEGNDNLKQKERNLKTCSFYFEDESLEEGFCTRYPDSRSLVFDVWCWHLICPSFGACRFQGAEYMYQGGCGELASWGTRRVEGRPPCR